MERKFNALRLLSTVYRVLAWIALVLGILGGLSILAISVVGGGALARLTYWYAPGAAVPPSLLQNGIVVGIVGFLGALLVSGLYSLILYAVSELILLAISVEENTRETAYYLRGEGTLSAPPPDTGVPLSS